MIGLVPELVLPLCHQTRVSIQALACYMIFEFCPIVGHQSLWLGLSFLLMCICHKSVLIKKAPTGMIAMSDCLTRTGLSNCKSVQPVMHHMRLDLQTPSQPAHHEITVQKEKKEENCCLAAIKN